MTTGFINNLGSGISNGINAAGSAFKNAQQALGGAAGSAGASPGEAVAKFFDDKAGEAKAVERAFDKSLVSGVAATLNALSPGNTATDMLAAIGVELTPAMKEGLSAVINGSLNAAFLPAAIMDVMDAVKASPVTGKPGKPVAIARPHTPTCPADNKPGTRRPHGGLVRTPPGYATIGIVPGPGFRNPKGLQSIMARLDAMLRGIASLLQRLAGLPSPEVTKGTKGTEPKAPETKELTEVEKLPPNATFEDFVFALMMTIIKDQQGEIKKLSEELTQNKKEREVVREAKSAAKDAQIGTKVMSEVATAVGGLGGPIGSAVAGATKMVVERGAEKKVESLEAQEQDLADSRQLLAEKIKNEVQKLQEMMSCLSNILNTMHEGSMNAIRNIK